MKSKMFFFGTLLLIAGLLTFSHCTEEEDACPCNLPEIGEMDSTELETKDSGVKAEIELIAQAKYLRKLLEVEGKIDTDFDLESALRKIQRTSYTQEFYQWYKKHYLEVCMLMQVICREEGKNVPDEEFLRNTKTQLVNHILKLEEPTDDVDLHFSPESSEQLDSFYHRHFQIIDEMEQKVDEESDDLKQKRLLLTISKYKMALTYFKAQVNDYQFKEEQLGKAISKASSKLYSIQQDFLKNLQQ